MTITTINPSSLNAVKHGILSSQLLLPHESADDYASLLNELMSEYNPVGITEKTLVEDIANTIWRKRRFTLAERASINKGLNETVASPLMLANESDPTHLKLTETMGLSYLLGLNAAGLNNRKDLINRALTAIDEAVDSGNPSDALDSMPIGIVEAFEESEADIDAFIETEASNLLLAELRAIESIEEIRRQAYGSAVLAISFDTLARYDAHLTRQLKRLLEMLNDSQEMRLRKAKVVATIVPS